MNKEFFYMQKLAGLITESEYAAKLEERTIQSDPTGVKSIYFLKPKYGGPEEGGWWYDVYEYVCPEEDIDNEFSPEEAEELRSKGYLDVDGRYNGRYIITTEEYPKKLDGTDTYEPYS